jgi:hypothetical protein
MNPLVPLEIVLVTALNLVIVYVAAFVYHLGWYGVTWTIVASSLITASLTHIIIEKQGEMTHTIESDATIKMTTFLTSLLSSVAVFLMLLYRFDLRWAIGLSLLIGLESYFWRRALSIK